MKLDKCKKMTLDITPIQINRIPLIIDTDGKWKRIDSTTKKVAVADGDKIVFVCPSGFRDSQKTDFLNTQGTFNALTAK